jgi:hypothetical protein
MSIDPSAKSLSIYPTSFGFPDGLSDALSIFSAPAWERSNGYTDPYTAFTADANKPSFYSQVGYNATTGNSMGPSFIVVSPSFSEGYTNVGRSIPRPSENTAITIRNLQARLAESVAEISRLKRRIRTLTVSSEDTRKRGSRRRAMNRREKSKQNSWSTDSSSISTRELDSARMNEEGKSTNKVRHPRLYLTSANPSDS